MTHICVGKLTIIGSDNGLSPERRQAIIWTNAGILLIGTLGTNFGEISIEIRIFSFKKMGSKVSSAKWRPFCLGVNELTGWYTWNWDMEAYATKGLWAHYWKLAKICFDFILISMIKSGHIFEHSMTVSPGMLLVMTWWYNCHLFQRSKMFSNAFRPRQNCRHFAHDICRCIFWNFAWDFTEVRF